jgi:hypothetical protein
MIFYTNEGMYHPDRIRQEINLSHNTVFNVFMRVDVSGLEVDTPLFCRRVVEEAILDNYRVDGMTPEVSVLLYENAYPQQNRTANAIFKAFQQFPHQDRMLKVTTNKGEVYYGGNGFILDKDYNVLLLYTLHGLKNSDRTVTYKTGRIYVHPKVFVSNGLLEKGIVKTIIPAFVTDGIEISQESLGATSQTINVPVWRPDGRRAGVTRPLPEIVIADVTERFIVKPVKPNPVTYNNEAMNDFLLEHLDEVVRSTGIV